MKSLLLILLFLNIFSTDQKQSNLPIYNKGSLTVQGDWLIDKINTKAGLYQTVDSKLVFSNGIVSRTFTLAPNCATVGLDLLSNNESFLRSVRPEAEVEIDGIKFSVGGLTGQPIHNYLLPEWLAKMEADPSSFKLVNYSLGEIRERFPWKKRAEWMPKDMPWPIPGKELVFKYRLDDSAISLLGEKSLTDEKRPILVNDEFQTRNANWKIFASVADERNSFINEGKSGEIMALANTAVYADQQVTDGAKVFLAKLDPGTDKSAIYGPGMGLVFKDRVIKMNFRTANRQIRFFDGTNDNMGSVLQADQPIWFRMEIIGDKILASWSLDKKEWTQAGTTTIAPDEKPLFVRLGKMDGKGGNTDSSIKGEQGRCHFESFQLLGIIPEAAKSAGNEQIGYLKGIEVEVHYELYDGMPLISKWIKVLNHSPREVRINTFKSEILAVTEPESIVDPKKKWMLPNITVETDYNFGGMSDESIFQSSVAWNIDPLYQTQVNYERTTPCLLETYPKYGPDQAIPVNKNFESFRMWELLHDSREPERKGLEHRKIMRALAPWSTENPILMHVSSSKDEAVKKAVDQCAEVGFEMVIMTFGSGFSVENETPEKLERMKKLAIYAHSKGIALGGYSLLASRRVGGGDDVVMPEGMSPRFGNSPCLESKWGIKYFDELYNFYDKTGLDILEHDGSYPGDICAAKDHPGHTGLDDSQWNQYRKITGFYQWCRSRGIYLNVPDYYFLAGSNKTGMGYRETNWSLPREQQEMGWMFVPLVQYHGGGAVATIEPLKEHLTHYGQRLANLFGAGVQACYRGPQLYDAPETKTLVEKWVSFYKKHRRILDGDIIHIRRADGRDFDAILHVDPSGIEKGLLMMYNPLNENITRTIDVPVYYTGLKDKAIVKEQEGTSKAYTISRDYKIKLTVTIPAKGYQYYILK
jgi:hypothetical protein